MTIFTQDSSILDQAWVSIDLETTGLKSDYDEIIEVGAVKFQGKEILETYHTMVNPYIRLPEFTKRYTGITQREVDKAPPFATAAGEIAAFIGALPVIGHNVGFDLGFLNKKGLRLTNLSSDTWDMAFVLMPQAQEYSLSLLASILGITHPQPHRALPDALVTREVFLKLVEIALDLDLGLLSAIQRLASRSQWGLSHLFRGLEQERANQTGHRARDVGLTGLDMDSLRRRVHQPTLPLHPRREAQHLEGGFLTGLMGEEGPLAHAIPGYEARWEQVEMMKSVAEAINERHHLIVEGGTGIGKSWAYLLPAILYAHQNDRRVVISTNTINLQEQLLSKDIPALLQALQSVGQSSLQEFRFTQLKGRSNYLCFKRWWHLQNSETPSSEEARFLSKLLVWLQTTSRGDRGELNLTSRAGSVWDRVSAQGAPECPSPEGLCFLRAAREKANYAHLVIVNHALLLSDLAMGGGLIPDYDTIIIDEAHHLEEEATRHLGFEVAQSEVEEYLQSLSGQRGLLQEIESFFRGSLLAQSHRETVERLVGELAGDTARAKEHVEVMYKVLNAFLQNHREGDDRDGLGISSSLRTQPGWSQVEIAWDNADATLAEVRRGMERLELVLRDLEGADVPNYEGLMLELSNHLQLNTELSNRIREFILSPRGNQIYWLSQSAQDGALKMHAAPLHVGEELEKRLFSQKECVVLTSATLSTDGGFEHIRERLGLADAQELLIGSPFDYPKAALLCLPQDMPEPISWAYQSALEQAVVDLALAAEGRTMVLFTSHASLQATRSALRSTLEAQDMRVLAQGVDGTPRQILRNFLENPRSVLLGTSSFWEGVDLAGESLKVLVLARLPFNVPTEPVFAARSDLYEDPFNEYALPQAVLRFRQGFGRLIRTKSDKGAVVVLDRRLTSKSYGKAFLNSIPQSAVTKPTLREMAGEVARWIGS